MGEVVKIVQEPNLNTIENLQGDWKVERLSGVLPMPRVWKRVSSFSGSTTVWRSPGIPFRLEPRDEYIALIYRSPLNMMVDELRYEAPHSWHGRATVAGVEYALFRMTRIQPG